MEKVGLYTNPTMILTGVQAEDAESVIRLLCDKAMDNGCIEPVFVQAILEREKEYPTGLPTMVPLAIPHIHDGCLRSFFSMAVLDEPVSFRCMGDPDEVIETRLVFLFGITDPSYQTAVLRKFSTIFQSEEELHQMMETKEAEKVMEQMKALLDEYLVTEA